MNKLLTVFYRVCGSECDGNLKPERPYWFDKRKCFKSFYNEFGNRPDVEIKVLWDGPENHLADYIKNHAGIKYEKLNFCSNKKSLEYCYFIAQNEESKFLFFLEDDYEFTPGSYQFLMEGVFLKGLFTLYHHPDRITRKDDITKDRESIDGLYCGYVRTAESTTQTFAINKKIFDDNFELFIECCNNTDNDSPNDRILFRRLIERGVRLWSSIDSYSTHCVQQYLGMYINWEKFNNSIVI